MENTIYMNKMQGFAYNGVKLSPDRTRVSGGPGSDRLKVGLTDLGGLF